MIWLLYLEGICWSQREGSNLRPADDEPNGLALYSIDNKCVQWDAEALVLGLCSPAAMRRVGDKPQVGPASRLFTLWPQPDIDVSHLLLARIRG
jgi:hypothetical protein